MKTYLDCIPCFFRQALAAVRMATDDEIIHRRVLVSVSNMIPDLELNASPPEIAQQVYRMVYEITGNDDPHIEAKKLTNTSAMSLYPRMKDIVDYSNDTLETGCKLAIAGNAIDLGAQAEYGSIFSIIEDSVGYQLDQKQCSCEMLSYCRAAELIISKGQGNYESLSGRPENIFFLFKVKCPVIARDSGYDLDRFVLTASKD